MVLNTRIVELGEKLGIPVCATCDSHYLFEEDKCIAISCSASGAKANSDEAMPDLFLRTTKEMLAEFAYLGEEGEGNRHHQYTSHSRASDAIAPLPPDGKLTPRKINGSDEELKRMCYAKAHRLYGKILPEPVAKRLESELASIIGNGFGVLYYIAHKLVKNP